MTTTVLSMMCVFFALQENKGIRYSAVIHYYYNENAGLGSLTLDLHFIRY